MHYNRVYREKYLHHTLQTPTKRAWQAKKNIYALLQQFLQIILIKMGIDNSLFLIRP